MAVMFGSADEDDDDHGGGGPLREKLEQQININKALTEENNLYKARDFLAEKGLTLVKPEELKGVKPDEFEAHALKLQEDRQQLQQELLREALQRQGLDGDDLEEALTEMVSSKGVDAEAAEMTRRARAAGSIPGAPITRVDPSKVQGFDAIRLGVESNARRKRT